MDKINTFEKEAAEKIISAWRDGKTVTFETWWTEDYPSWLGSGTKTGITSRKFRVTGQKASRAYYVLGDLDLQNEFMAASGGLLRMDKFEEFVPAALARQTEMGRAVLSIYVS